MPYQRVAEFDPVIVGELANDETDDVGRDPLPILGHGLVAQPDQNAGLEEFGADEGFLAGGRSGMGTGVGSAA